MWACIVIGIWEGALSPLWRTLGSWRALGSLKYQSTGWAFVTLRRAYVVRVIQTFVQFDVITSKIVGQSFVKNR